MEVTASLQAASDHGSHVGSSGPWAAADRSTAIYQQTDQESGQI